MRKAIRSLLHSLARRAVDLHMTSMHDPADLGGAFNLIIVDGPPGGEARLKMPSAAWRLQ